MYGFRHDNLTDLYKDDFDYDKLVDFENYQPKNNQMETFSLKKELKSFIISFFVAFLLVVYEQLNSLTVETFKNGAYLGLLFGAVRAGVKAVIELFLIKFKK